MRKKIKHYIFLTLSILAILIAIWLTAFKAGRKSVKCIKCDPIKIFIKTDSVKIKKEEGIDSLLEIRFDQLDSSEKQHFRNIIDSTTKWTN